MKKNYIFIMLFLMFVTIVSSSPFLLKQGDITTIEIPLYENDMIKCSTCTCTYAIQYPNGSNAIRNGVATINSNYAIIVPYTNHLGKYSVDLHCTNGADSGATTFYYDVTGMGLEQENSFLVLAIILVIAIMLSLFVYLKMSKFFGSFMIFLIGFGVLFNMSQVGWIAWVIIGIGFLMTIFSLLTPEKGKRRKKSQIRW